jgi:two-component system, OmpR family, sensor histidine kinase ChvG
LSEAGADQTKPNVEEPQRSVLGRLASWLNGFVRPQRSRPRGLAYRPTKRRLSLLTLKVIGFNFVALLVFGAGIYWLQEIRVSLVDERVKSLRTQAEIVAAALARYGAVGEIDSETATELDDLKAARVLNGLVAPTGMRARVFDRSGRPIQDTRFILSRNQVQARELPPPGQIDLIDELQSGLRSGLYQLRAGKEIPPIVNDEPQQAGESFEEVRHALERAEAGSAERINSDGNLIVSVAVPIRRLQYVMGVLMLSTEAGDIDDALANEAAQMVAGAAIGFAVILAASLIMLWHVTGPIRKLSQGAELVRSGGRVFNAIPNLARRHDEIGDLSISLRAMTAALYARMDAIEQFAADVAHEIKNPLTSVASAIETLRRTTDEDKRQKLMGVVRDDVRRLNRLISEISDASRLDAELSRAKAHPVDVAALVNALAEMFQDPDVQGAPKIVLDLPASGLRVRGLEGPLAQVFRNIIENAMSFSPKEGELHISARSASGRAVITIEDQGPGIPDENLEVIFRRFYTARPLSHGFGKNSGLGLSISRQIVEVHDGKIFAENLRDADGKITGARFVVELPLEPEG